MARTSNEDLERQIVAHLIKKYRPRAVYLSGSRASGRNRPDSDWDFHLVVADHVKPLSNVFKGFSIDIKYLIESKIGDSVIDTPYSPAVPFRCLHRDKNYKSLLLDLEKRTREAYKRKPKRWTKIDKTENRLKVLRFMEAAEGNIHNPIVAFRHLCKFFDLVTLYWFGLRQRWSQPIYLAVDIFKEEDPSFYKALMSLSNEESLERKIKLIRSVYRSVFKDNIL